MVAAIQINILISSNITNKSIRYHAIFFRCWTYRVVLLKKIIFQNTWISISKTKEFITYKDNQIFILIHILQGERELVKDCISLHFFILKNIKPQKTGLVCILITFHVDTNRLIHIKTLKKTVIKKNIKIDNNVVLKTLNFSKIVQNSLKHVKENYYLRVKEEKNEM